MSSETNARLAHDWRTIAAERSTRGPQPSFGYRAEERTNRQGARLFAVDAHSGARCSTFGNNGEVSLLTGMGEVKRGFYFVTSPPTIAWC
jgi:glucose dehydrogenase